MKNIDALIKEYQNGNKTLLKTILNNTNYYIEEIIKKYISNSAYDYELLYKIGEYALIDAINNYQSNDFSSYAKLCILNKLKDFLKRYPNPSIDKNHTLMFENINKNLKLNINDKEYLTIRAFIEMQSAKLKVCIKERFGYYGRCLSNEEIALKYNYNLEGLTNALNNFCNKLTQKYLGSSYISSKESSFKEEKIVLKSSIYDYFDGFSMEEVKYAISSIPKRDIIYLKYGHNLDQNNEIDDYNNNLIAYELIDVIKSFMESRRKNNNDFLSNFNGYAKEEVIYAISNLPKKERNIIYKRYNKNLEGFNIASYKEIEEIKNHIIPKLQDYLKNHKITIKSIFEYFPDNTIEQVIYVISTLPISYKSIIIKRYGENLDEFNFLNDKEIILEKTIISRIKSSLSEIKDLSTITSILGVPNKEVLKACLKKLDEQDGSIIYQKYVLKKELNTNDLIRLYFIIIPKLKELIKLNNNLIINKLPNRTYEEIKSAISKLPENYQAIVYKRYGHNLDEFNSIDYNERNIFYKYIFPRLKNPNLVVQTKKGQSLLELLSDYSKEQILLAISTLPKEEQTLTFKKYGEGLNEYHYLPKEEQKIIKNLKIKLLFRLNKKKSFKVIKPKKEKIKNDKSGKSLLELLSDYSKEQILLAISTLPKEEQTLTFKKYGEGLNEHHTLPKEEQKIINNLKAKLLNRLNKKDFKPKKEKISKRDIGKTILEKFNTYSEEEIKAAIKLLSKKEQELIYKRYGVNLDEYNKVNKEEEQPIINAINRLKRTLQGKKTFISLTERCKHLMDEIKIAFKKLSIPNQKYLVLKYGENLDEYHILELKERTKANNATKMLIKHLNNPQIKKRYRKLIDILNEFNIEDIKKIISILTKEEQELIYKKYGESLDEYHTVSSEDNKTINNALNLIKNHLKNDMNKKIVRRKSKNILEMLSMYSKEDILKAINKLSEEEQKIIFMKYGTNLNEKNRISLSDKENHRLRYIILKRIPALIENKQKCARSNKHFIDYFEGYSLVEIKDAISNLKKEHQEIIFARFGQNLDEINVISKSSYNSLKSTIIPLINKVLSGEMINTNKGIMDYFPNCSTLQLLSVIKHLTLKEQELLFKKYGLNLDENNHIILNDKENHQLSYIILKRIPSLIEDKQKYARSNKHLIDYFEGYSLVEIKDAISNLKKEHQEIIFARFGQNLDEINVISKSSYNSLKSTIIPLINKVLSGEMINTNKGIMDYFPNCSTLQLLSIIKHLTLKEQELLFRKYGLNLDENNLFNNNDNAKISFIRKKIKKMLNGDFLFQASPLSKIISMPKEEYISKINHLLASEREELYAYFGYDLERPEKVPFNLELINKVEKVIIPKIVSLNDKKDSTLKFDNALISLVQSIVPYQKEEIIIFIMRISLDETNLTMDMLCNYFNKNEEEINKITLKVLKSLNNNFDKVYTAIINSLNKKEDSKKYQIEM